MYSYNFIYLTSHQLYHERTKHTNNFDFIGYMIDLKETLTLKIYSKENQEDVLTK